MNKLTGTIYLASENTTQITNASCNISHNNISADIQSVVGLNKYGNDVFIIGPDTLNGSRFFASRVNYYIGSVTSNPQRVFEIPYEITLTGKNITSFTMIFDTIRNGYPTKLSIDSIEYTCNSVFLNVDNLPSATSHVIKFYEWSISESPLIVQGIFSASEIMLDTRNLVSFRCTSQRVNDIDKPQFGILSSQGEVVFKDQGGFLLKYIQNATGSKSRAIFEVFNDSNKKRSALCTMYTDRWDYDPYAKNITVSLQDNLLEWQDILVEEMPAQDEPSKGPVLQDIADYLMEKTPSKYRVIFSPAASRFLSMSQGKYAFMHKGNLWSCWNRFAVACGFNIYVTPTGEVVVCMFNELEREERPETPDSSGEVSAIAIPSSCIYDIKSDKILDNKIKGVDYEESYCNFVTDYKELVKGYSLNEIKGNGPVDIDYKVKVFQEGAGRQGVAYLDSICGKGTVTIPKKSKGDNNRILKIYNLVDSNNEPNIKYSIVGHEDTYDIWYDEYKNDTLDTTPPLKILHDEFKSSRSFNGVINQTSNTTVVTLTNGVYMGEVTASIKDMCNLSTVEVREDDNNFYIDYVIPIQSMKWNITGAWFNGTAYKSDIGSCVITWATELNISIYGDLYRFNIDTNRVTNGAIQNYTMETNEVVQKGILISDDNQELHTIGEAVSSEIMKEYKDGKETAILLCQVGQYNYHGGSPLGDIAISPKLTGYPSTFHVGDEVIPYIRGKNNKDVELAHPGNPSSSKFVVCKVEFIYDGVLWQKLYLQSIKGGSSWQN